MPTYKTLIDVVKLARKGVSLSDKWCAFLLAGLPKMGHHRRKMRAWWLKKLNAMAGNGDLILHLYLENRPVKFAMRKGNEADYLIGGELIAQAYAKPSFTPKLIIDGGANIGMFSVLANSYFPGAHIICYEPDESNYRQLQKNIGLNGINAVIQHAGLWSEQTTLYFHESSSQIGYIDSTPPGLPIHCVLPEISEESWLKLDIEGAEHQVLPALFEQRTFPRWISMEVHFMNTKGTTLLNALKDAGYELRGQSDEIADCYVVEAVHNNAITSVNHQYEL